MFKGLTLAALLGVATTKSVSAWIESDNFVDKDLFKLGYNIEFDFGYGTFYEGIPPIEGLGL